ncbi:unnamed protein product [Sympodiomycopsis kandeliae]
MLKAYMSRQASSTSQSTKTSSSDSGSPSFAPKPMHYLQEPHQHSTRIPNFGLHAAATSGNLPLVKYALESGQPANCVLSGVTPLHAAATTGNIAVINLLLASGADVNALRSKTEEAARDSPGAEGSTALHFASANGHFDAVKVLLEHGAIPAVPDKDGVVPEALAIGTSHTDCAELIKAWTATYGQNGLADVMPASSRTPHPSNAGSITPASSAPQSPVKSSHSMRSQTSLEQLSSAAAGVKATLLSKRSNSKLNKATSNPVLRGVPLSNAKAALSTRQPRAPSTADSNLRSRSPENADLPSAASDIGTGSPGRQSQHHERMTSESGLYGNDSDLGFATSTTPTPTATSSQHLSETKRRPSLPSLLEKAAHPASSLKAALTNNQSKHNLTSPDHHLTEVDGGMSSPRNTGKGSGKRSISNFLRRAASSLANPESGSHAAKVATWQNAAMQLPPSELTASKQNVIGTNKFRADLINLKSAPAYQTSFPRQADSSVSGPPSDPTVEAGLPATSSEALTGGSLQGTHHRAQSATSRSGSISPKSRTQVLRPPVPFVRRTLAQEIGSTTDSHPAHVDSKMLGAQGPRRRAQSTGATGRRFAHLGDQSCIPPSPSISDLAEKRGITISVPEDAQEFLGDASPEQRRTALAEQQRQRKEERHLLPASLRSLSDLRNSSQPSTRRPSRSAATAFPTDQTAPRVTNGDANHEPDSIDLVTLAAQHRLGRQTSLGSLSATSHNSAGASGTSSVAHDAVHSASPSTDSRLSLHANNTMSDDGTAGSGSIRAGRSIQRLANRPSTSSIRSASMSSTSGSTPVPSAAEQALAIIRNAEQYGKGGSTIGADGRPTTLAAQLAAYGEALAQEQQRESGSERGASTPSTPLSYSVSLAGSPPSMTTLAQHPSSNIRSRSGSASSGVPPHLFSTMTMGPVKGVRHESSRETLGSQSARQLPSVSEDQHGSEPDESLPSIDNPENDSKMSSPSAHLSSRISQCTSSGLPPSLYSSNSDTTIPTTVSSPDDTVRSPMSGIKINQSNGSRSLHSSRSSNGLSSSCKSPPSQSQPLRNQNPTGRKMSKHSAGVVSSSPLTPTLGQGSSTQFIGRVRASSDDNRAQRSFANLPHNRQP